MALDKPRRIWVLALVLVTGLICASSLSVKPSSAETSSVAEDAVERSGIRFSVALQRTVFRVGEPVNATFTVANISNQTITWFTVTSQMIDLEVYNESDERIFLWSREYAFFQAVTRHDLSPAENLVMPVVWPGTCNENVTSSQSVSVSPGRYFIVGYLLGSLGLFRTAPLEVDILSSAEVEFAIVGLVVAPVMVLLAVVLLARKK